MFVHLSFVLKLYSTRFVLAQLAAFGASFDSRSVCCRGYRIPDGGLRWRRQSKAGRQFERPSCLFRLLFLPAASYRRTQTIRLWGKNEEALNNLIKLPFVSNLQFVTPFLLLPRYCRLSFQITRSERPSFCMVCPSTAAAIRFEKCESERI